MNYITALTILNLVLWPFTIIGLGVVIKISRKEEHVDDSNGFNRVRIFWFALTRMSQMVDKFPWLKNDEWENINK